MLSSAPLNAPSLLSTMESLNAPLKDTFKDFLKATISDNRRHVRFLNMLSMLEHIGSRKIMLSQMKGILTQDILKHLAEETRHAFFFKREAEKLAEKSVEGYGDDRTMCAASGRIYFEKLDAALTADLRSADYLETRYLWVTLVVELRAVWTYRIYQALLDEADFPLSLRSVLAEEDKHLLDITSRLDEIGFEVKGAIDEACALENRLFKKLLASLSDEALAA